MKQPTVTVSSYLTAILGLYQESSKEKKGELLDHAELVTERSRKLDYVEFF